MGPNFSPERLHFLGDHFPQLSGAEFRIQELLDQRCLRILLPQIRGTLPQFLGQMQQGVLDREALNTLRAPFGADLFAGDAPNLFGVRLEKREIKLFAKTADKELLQILHTFGRKQDAFSDN